MLRCIIQTSLPGHVIPRKQPLVDPNSRKPHALGGPIDPAAPAIPPAQPLLSPSRFLRDVARKQPTPKELQLRVSLERIKLVGRGIGMGAQYGNFRRVNICSFVLASRPLGGQRGLVPARVASIPPPGRVAWSFIAQGGPWPASNMGG